MLPCTLRGAETGEVKECKTCASTVLAKVFACEKHGRCTVDKQAKSDDKGMIKCCSICPDRVAGDHHPTATARHGTIHYRDVAPGVPDPICSPEQANSSTYAARPDVRSRHKQALQAILRSEIPDLESSKAGFAGTSLSAPAGIITCGGGKYWLGVVILCRLLREVGCTLPIQAWHRGSRESVDPDDVANLGVKVIDADRLFPKFPSRIKRGWHGGGWEIKTYAMLHSGFERILFLDADAYCVRNPEPLFSMLDDSRFVYWQDLPSLDQRVKWEGFGIAEEIGLKIPPIQGGQFLLNAKTFRRELVVAHWLNQHSDYAYEFQFGDQDSWRVALAATGGSFKNLGRPGIKHGIFTCPFQGQTTIIHRCNAKLFPPEEKKANTRRYDYLPMESRVHEIYKELTNQPPTKAFAKVYASGVWGKNLSSGSNEKETAPYIETIQSLIDLSCVQKVVDLGCGDGFVSSRLKSPEFVGVDCFEPHVKNLRLHFPAREWLLADLDADFAALPSGDMALIKDVLHHWPSQLVYDWILRATKSKKWKWLVMTFDRDQNQDDCRMGGYRALARDKFPLSRISGLRKICDYLHKSIYLLDCR